ncbi:MAG: hypothetical protein RLZZ08_1052, partial [Pseudomonadota bacterium]
MQLPLLLARLVPVALIGALIPVAWANGAARLDAAYGTGARLSVRTPGLGPLLAASEREAKGGRPQRAIALAARAVTKAPIDAAAVRTLAIRSLEAGQSSRGEGLLRAAGGLGWYDVPTQLMWSDIAYSAGDLAVAVQRLDAAMRVTRGREAIV